VNLAVILQKIVGTSSDYRLTRHVFQRALGFTYLIAFLAVINQFRPLLGERGLLPVSQFVQKVPFARSPSLFFFFPNDTAFVILGAVGLALAIVATIGISERFGWGVSVGVWFLMWLIYLSFVNVGQTFYSFGWETMLLEAGFLAIFLGPRKVAPSVITIFFLRWMLFRVMFGAGLIKLRGDSCWKDYTCLTYHHETQPMPNPLSWYFHLAPLWFHKLGVLYNHFAELIVPFFYFAPFPLSAIAGVLTLFFHGFLFVSGNFAFLGFLTMVLAIPTFNDKILSKIIRITIPETLPPGTLHLTAIYALTLLVAALSIGPIVNLFSPRQAMNRSFEPLHLVNTYGAFGSITKKRFEIVIEGTIEEVSEDTEWKEYEFKAKPTSLSRSPPQYAPYHLRLDWLMWFEGINSSYKERLGGYVHSPWFVHLLAKFLEADKGVIRLIRESPFGEERPNAIRALVYQYNFTTAEERRQTGNIWKREFIDTYFGPVSLESPEFKQTLEEYGWGN